MARGWRPWSRGSGVISSQVRLGLEQPLIRSPSTLMETGPAPGAISRQGASSPGYVSARYYHVQRIVGSVTCHSTSVFHDPLASDGRALEESFWESIFVFCRLLLPIQASKAGRRGLTNPNFLGLTPGRPLQGDQSSMCWIWRGVECWSRRRCLGPWQLQGREPVYNNVLPASMLPQSLAALSSDVGCHPCYSCSTPRMEAVHFMVILREDNEVLAEHAKEVSLQSRLTL